MRFSGQVQSLLHRTNEPIDYYLELGNKEIYLNDQLQKSVTISFDHKIECIACGRSIKKTYNNGYCYPCFRDLPENDLCIVKPHECHFDKGTCRDSEWGQRHCMQPHYVYLALSSDVKVGLTRKGNELRRWTDQGAVSAFPIAQLPTRKKAGELEIYLSQFLNDKTDWRRMLKDNIAEKDLCGERKLVLEKIPEEFRGYVLPDETLLSLTYPKVSPAIKLKSFDLQKGPVTSATFLGVKGQYLIFDKGVFNARKHRGFSLTIRFEERTEQPNLLDLA